jgi:hypothetical protein
MQNSRPIGLILLALGLILLFLLRNALIRMVIFVLEFLGVLLGFLLIAAGLAILFGGTWISGRRYVQ